MRRAVLVLVTLAVMTAAVFAQNPGAPRFDVASVRLAPGPGLTSQRMTIDVIVVDSIDRPPTDN